MDNFLFALNATGPVFLVMGLGYLLRRWGLLNEAFNSVANQYVFKCALPVSLFLSMAKMDIYSDFDVRFCLFCFLSTVAMFLIVWGFSWALLKDKTQVGAFSQAAVRSSAAILGVAFAVQIYGDAGMVPMMIMSAVPFFNVFSVLILSFSPQIGPDGREMTGGKGTAAVKRACIGVAKNPLIIGIVLGIPFALLRVSLPTIVTATLSMVGGTASPIALLVVGASFSGGEAMTRWKPAAFSSFIKLLLLPACLLPLAAWLGFRGSAMVAILIMAGSPTTVAAFVMAKNMHADGVLTANAVLLSTILSSMTITFWIYLLRAAGMI